MKASNQNSRHCEFDGLLVSQAGWVKHINKYHSEKPGKTLTSWTEAAKYFMTKEEWQRKRKLEKLNKPVDYENLYRELVHYYIDKRGFTMQQANDKAQEIILEQKAERAAALKELQEKII